MAEYYPNTYHSIPESSLRLEAESTRELYKIQLVQRFITKGKLLEIGPSSGAFCYLAKQAGFDVDAIEMNKWCCDFLNDVVGVRATHSSDPVKELQKRSSYDVIALWHVIEHLSNPWAALDAICAAVSPGGIVVLASPNPKAWQFSIMGRYWPHVDAPRHLWLIPMEVLKEKMRAAGLVTVLATTTDRGSIAWNAFGWEFFFGNMTSSSIMKRILRLAGKIVSLCVAPFETSEGRGSCYTMVLRKES